MMSNVRVYCEKMTTLCPFSFNFSNNLSKITILPEAFTISSFVSPSLLLSAPGKRYLGCCGAREECSKSKRKSKTKSKRKK